MKETILYVCNQCLSVGRGVQKTKECKEHKTTNIKVGAVWEAEQAIDATED